MTPEHIAAIRLASQRIAIPAAAGAGALVAHMGAMQAQDYPNLLWGIGLRLAGAGIGEVRSAFSQRAVVRSWLLRGTLHVAAAADLRWMLALLGPRNIGAIAGRERQLELDEAVFSQARKLLGAALRDGQALSRTVLFALLEEAGIKTGQQRGIHILWHLNQEGMLCFADSAGKQPSFALLDDWLPAAGPPLQRDEALAELATRYATSHGPASAADLAWWAGLTLADAKRALAAARGLVCEDGLWMAEAAVSAPGGVFLLPGFDEYLLGYKERGAVLAPEHAARVVPGANGVFKPMIVVDGRVVGTWQRKQLETDLFAPLKRAHSKALAVALGRHRQFCGEQP